MKYMPVRVLLHVYPLCDGQTRRPFAMTSARARKRVVKTAPPINPHMLDAMYEVIESDAACVSLLWTGNALGKGELDSMPRSALNSLSALEGSVRLSKPILGGSVDVAP